MCVLMRLVRKKSGGEANGLTMRDDLLRNTHKTSALRKNRELQMGKRDDLSPIDS
jgi:hypothetical protein